MKITSFRRWIVRQLRGASIHRLFNYIIFVIRGVDYDAFPIINGVVTIRGSGELQFGRNVTINSSFTSNPVGMAERTAIFVMKGAIVTIGEGTGISNTLIYCHQRIDIKENVFIGGSVQIFDTDFHSIGYEDRLLNGDNTVKCAPVLIKKGAFIGTSSIILKGVTIGAKSIVAAGSVVSKSIPDGEIWGGNPAKYIRDL